MPRRMRWRPGAKKWSYDVEPVVFIRPGTFSESLIERAAYYASQGYQVYPHKISARAGSQSKWIADYLHVKDSDDLIATGVFDDGERVRVVQSGYADDLIPRWLQGQSDDWIGAVWEG